MGKAKEKEMIRQHNIEEIYSLRTVRSNMEKRCRELKKKEDELVKREVERLKVGVPVEPGKYHIRLDDGGRYPSWKDEFIKRLGEAEAEKVIASTPFKEQVVIELTDEE